MKHEGNKQILTHRPTPLHLCNRHVKSKFHDNRFRKVAIIDRVTDEMLNDCKKYFASINYEYSPKNTIQALTSLSPYAETVTFI